MPGDYVYQVDLSVCLIVFLLLLFGNNSKILALFWSNHQIKIPFGFPVWSVNHDPSST